MVDKPPRLIAGEAPPPTQPRVRLIASGKYIRDAASCGFCGAVGEIARQRFGPYWRYSTCLYYSKSPTQNHAWKTHVLRTTV